MNQKINFDVMKQLNVSLIMECIREKGPISRADIAELTGLTPASISKITRELIKKNFIRENGLGKSSGGRPPVLLELNPKAGYIIGVNLGPEILEVIITNLEADILVNNSKTLENLEQNYVLDELFNLIYQTIAESKVDKEEIIGIGMAVHGLINSETGISIFAPHYNWKNVAIKKLIEEEFQIPTFIDNDARAMALGEQWFGIARNSDDFITINIGNGIGSGIVINGELYQGVNYSAGEIGHIVVDNDGPKCSCGNYGCLESLASNPRITERARKLIKQGAKSKITNLVNDNLDAINIQHVCLAAKQRDEVAQQVLKEVGRYLGIGIAYLLNILNPELIVIVGDINEAKGYIFKYIKEVIEVKALEVPAENIKILATKLKGQAATIGGVTLVLKELFAGPELLE
ncbi:transcriptional regulator/sugar kinase [Halobacteroides halobius DSM 5150]|uniref:Transcriptional regulator/sugar kinase n=1 Tax=Halobacteroides halobius (strain ATCC 35273 / DSM 5150 / MD-1) TaxID=748449 RepID=L0KA78_HALHC|nr:ROK family transcriptional regulator [Halobacteroides halobius]AGB41274.1 transcriptional regulator/sugar kinase [Halobacteroides halobius DSM 5150]